MNATAVSKLSATAIAAAAVAMAALLVAVPSPAHAGVKATAAAVKKAHHKKQSPCKPIVIRSKDRKKVRPLCRLMEIVEGKVPCMHTETMKVRDCKVDPKVTNVVRSQNDGTYYAMVGTNITLDGKANGHYAIVSKFTEDTMPKCVRDWRNQSHSATKGRRWDAASASPTEDGGGVCRVETPNAVDNVGPDLVSYIPTEMCTSNVFHPDGATGGWNPVKRFYCYRGNGAGLANIYGREVDYWGNYLPNNSTGDRCHMLQGMINGVWYEGPAQKRTSIDKYPTRWRGDTYRWMPYSAAAEALMFPAGWENNRVS